MASDSKRSVFVLMPFDDDFQLVYDHFLKKVLEEVGFVVSRADDIQSQQNILKDIVKGIAESQLVVADLTNANPNVFYELGIAHAIGKPVLLVTQSIYDVPFDLKSYRLVEYNTHFVKIKTAIDNLRNYGREFLEDNIPFGNPVTDFHPTFSRENRPAATTSDEIAEDTASPDSKPDTDKTLNTDASSTGFQPREDDRGILDHAVELHNGYTLLATIMEGVTKDLNEVTLSIEMAASDLNAIAANPSSSSANAAQNIARRLAGRLNNFNNKLIVANESYSANSLGMENSLEFIIFACVETSGSMDPEFEGNINILKEVRETAIESRDSFNNLANLMDALPRIERRLNREVSRGSEQVRIMAGNIDRTISSITRAVNVIDM